MGWPIALPRRYRQSQSNDLSFTARRGDGRESVRNMMLRLTQLFNLTGHPAISLPLVSDGWPVGLQLVGRRGHTADLLAIAATCEKLVRQ